MTFKWVMKLLCNLVMLSTLLAHGHSLQVPLLPDVASSPLSSHIQSPLISIRTEEYVHTLLDKWNASGLSVAVVRKDEKAPNGWRHEFGAYGVADAYGSLMTPDSVFAIASNSKLFLAISVGLLISNETLAKERGMDIRWSTKVKDLIPEWGLMDNDMNRGVTLQDMLSHRTGMPRHDYSGVERKGGVAEMISTLRYLRPSAEFRETFQYNNLMYEALSYLPQTLLNQTYESYIAQHLFHPLNMTSTTFSVAEAETWGTLANGFLWDMEDITKGKNGTRVAVNPYFQRPGEERTWAGAGGVLTSARDLATWVSMLMNKGRHPYTDEVVVPAAILERIAYGRTVTNGKPEYAETSIKAYGSGQWRYSYQGHDIIEHGGNNPGFKSQVARFPTDNLGIIALSNDGTGGGFIIEAVKFRIADELLDLKEPDWNDRFEKQWKKYVKKSQNFTPRPSPHHLPVFPFSALSEKTFSHPSYGILQPCLVPDTPSAFDRSEPASHTHAHCDSLLQSRPVQRILSVSDLSIPTYIIPWKRTFATHVVLAHFSGNLFNATVLWTNSEVREREGYGPGDDLVIGFNEHFEVEWVNGGDDEDAPEKEEGLAFKGGFWGKEGLDSQSPGGEGKDSAEVWFAAKL
ncbi:hypothetical protein HYPSUDRAFT_65659 [Hypholoma sublateritium FD-334 SS-4]|uniref:Beta-lactamase-related domain-containing protein n=1 Tax=Hypholoma sublateritium (strain FD-334 SS-4) TaxID=945553 RepID=A0A0D2PXK1_HYPSF|nr:hypothetical protein HYPSUDRAFT_65659 [Hypholoma sublateritium FD-334 SS-4]